MTRGRMLALGAWLGVASLVVLAAKWIAYALAPPSPLRTGLEHAAGGPKLVVVALAALGICGSLAAAVLWLASMTVRERAARSPRRTDAPRLRVVPVLAHSLVLSLLTCAAFAVFDSYLHVRAGLAWHGISCLTGPVHVNAIPILCGLSMLAAAAIDASRHVLAWMRRTIRLLLDPPPRLEGPAPLPVPIPHPVPPPQFRFTAARPRPPPLPVG